MFALRTQALVLGSLLLTGSAGAQNLIENPSFDTDLSVWSFFPSETQLFEWSSLDASASLDSGSARAINSQPGSGTSYFQLVEVPAGSAGFSVSAMVNIPPAGPGEAGVELWWRENCSSVIEREEFMVAISDGWVEVGGDGLVPPGADCVTFLLRIRSAVQDGEGEPFEVFFDDAYIEFADEPISPPDFNLVENGDFNSNATAVWGRSGGAGITVDWSSMDADDSPTSGSGHIALTKGSARFFQCLEEIGLGPWSASADLLSIGPGDASFAVEFYESTTCNNIQESVSLGSVSDTEDWFHLSDMGELPESVGSIRVVLEGRNLSGGTQELSEAFFDNVRVEAPEPSRGVATALVLLTLASLRATASAQSHVARQRSDSGQR